MSFKKEFRDIVILLRVQQYFKNLIIFFPLFFGLKFFKAGALIETIFTFFCFSVVASAVYVFNDYCDRENDKRHPVKKYRSLASGLISAKKSMFLMAALAIIGFSISILIDIRIFYILLAYAAINVLYTLKLKYVPLIDILIISLGFVARLFAGSFSANVKLSMWIIIITFLLATFLALAKRRGDLLLCVSAGSDAWPVLAGNYNLKFLNLAITMTASIIMVSYLMYSISPAVIEKIGSDKLYLTSIFVLLGILRYMQLIFVKGKGESPTEILLKDKIIQLAIVGWLFIFGILLYY